MAALLFMPHLGWIHHINILRFGKRTVSSYVHLFIGRVCIPLGILNGVFGLQLSGQQTGVIVSFGVVGLIMFLLYLGSVFVGEWRRAKIASEEVKAGYTSGDE
jgi:hypothetical protein